MLVVRSLKELLRLPCTVEDCGDLVVIILRLVLNANHEHIAVSAKVVKLGGQRCDLLLAFLFKRVKLCLKVVHHHAVLAFDHLQSAYIFLLQKPQVKHAITNVFQLPGQFTARSICRLHTLLLLATLLSQRIFKLSFLHARKLYFHLFLLALSNLHHLKFVHCEVSLFNGRAQFSHLLL